jgi:PD-(D/E)XK nuclease superfamily
LEIAGIAHRENENSRIYAYFLDQNKNQELSSLFLYALLSLAKEKSDKEIPIDSFYCNTEEATRKGNRIDIILNDEQNESAVLIENKIFHQLNNDLVDYWSHFKYEDENKIGVLLTLSKMEIPEVVKDKFVNITHLEWINKVKENGLPSGLSIKLYTYLNDFFQTIENLTNTTEMNDQVKFYFQHTTQVLKAKQTADEASAFISGQMEVLAGNLGWSTYGRNASYRSVWDAELKADTFYTIWFDPLLKGERKVGVIIELIRDDINRQDEIRRLLKDDEKFLSLNSGDAKSNYVHFRVKYYDLSMEEIENLADTLFLKIQEDFEPVMKQILNLIYPFKY